MPSLPVAAPPVAAANFSITNQLPGVGGGIVGELEEEYGDKGEKVDDFCGRGDEGIDEGNNGYIYALPF